MRRYHRRLVDIHAVVLVQRYPDVRFGTVYGVQQRARFRDHFNRQNACIQPDHDRGGTAFILLHIRKELRSGILRRIVFSRILRTACDDHDVYVPPQIQEQIQLRVKQKHSRQNTARRSAFLLSDKTIDLS